MRRLHRFITAMLLLLGSQAKGQLLWQEVGGGVTGGRIVDMDVDTASGLIYLCGDFNEAGGNTARGTVAWDGQSWVMQGIGAAYLDTCTFSSCSDLFCIARNKDNLFASGSNGYIDSSGTIRYSNLTRWDGTHWDTCGLPNTPSKTVATSNKQTFLFGLNAFHVNGCTIPNVAIWNGDAWENFTDYLDLEGGFISAVEYYKGMYHFGGNFRHQPGIKEIAAWDGVQWLPLGNGILGDSWVFNMKEYQGLMFVAGEFNWAIGNAGDYIMAWDGAQWLPCFGENVQFTSQVRKMDVIEGKLYMHGENFVRQNGVWHGPYSLARYDGVEFCSFGGIGTYNVYDFAGLNGRLYASIVPAQWPGNPRNFVEYIGTPTDEICIPVSPPNAIQPAHRGFAQVFPNPAHDQATLTTLVSTPGEVTVQVCSATGTVLRKMHQMAEATGSVDIALDLRGLAPGAYIAVVASPDGVSRAKVVVR